MTLSTKSWKIKRGGLSHLKIHYSAIKNTIHSSETIHNTIKTPSVKLKIVQYYFKNTTFGSSSTNKDEPAAVPVNILFMRHPVS